MNKCYTTHTTKKITLTYNVTLKVIQLLLILYTISKVFGMMGNKAINDEATAVALADNWPTVDPDFVLQAVINH
jgi:hypothetical protein